MILYAKSVKEGYKATSEAMKAETEAYNKAHKTWVAGMLELKQKKGIPVYPDANSTLRLTYGKIGSYEPQDGKEYLYYTTLEGVMEYQLKKPIQSGTKLYLKQKGILKPGCKVVRGDQIVTLLVKR